MITAPIPTGTRAVLIKHAPGAYPTCEACGGSLFGHGNKGRAPSICCNIADGDGIIRQVVHFHPTECYDGRYGPVTKAPLRVANLRQGKMQ